MMRVVIDNGGTSWLTPLAMLLAVVVVVVVVVVGGLVNWVAQRWLADKHVERERQVAKYRAAADAAVQTRIDKAEMRTAAGLIQADLPVAAGHLKTIVRTGEWAEFRRLDLRHWDAEQRTLAKRLDRDDWQAVSLAALELPALEAGWRLVDREWGHARRESRRTEPGRCGRHRSCCALAGLRRGRTANISPKGLTALLTVLVADLPDLQSASDGQSGADRPSRSGFPGLGSACYTFWAYARGRPPSGMTQTSTTTSGWCWSTSRRASRPSAASMPASASVALRSRRT